MRIMSGNGRPTATAERLPAGQWRCRLVNGGESTAYAETVEAALAAACRIAGLDPAGFRPADRVDGLVRFEIGDESAPAGQL